MSYCTASDVESYYLNKKFSCSDYITNGEVNSFIIQDTALIDSVLKTRYSLPITGQSDLLILKMINEGMVVGTVDDIVRERSEDDRFERSRNTRKEALAWLEKIKTGDVVLDGTEKDSPIFFNKFDSDGNIVEKRFKDSNIEPTNEILDRERRTVIRVT